MSTLSTDLSIAPSQLLVHSLQIMTEFYRDYVGLEVLSKSDKTVLLGYGQTGIIELVAKAKLLQAPPTAAGLFHNAILFDSRGQLVQSVARTVEASPALFQGTGDHLVSEAFYFADPEGNGLELYYDRPREQWQWEDGQIVMDTKYIDPLSYLRKYSQDASGGKARKIGHVHLRVGDISLARAFYVDMLGFEVTASSWPGALFVSIGGYHHHIGLNTWASRGAGKREPALGFSGATFHLQAEADVAALAQRLESKNYAFILKNGVLETADPWGNRLIFVTNS